MPGPNPILKTRIDSATRDRFVHLARTQHLSESELLRRAIQRELGEPAQGVQPAEPARDPTDIDRITVRLPRHVLRAARDRSTTTGLAVSRWVAALVQSTVSRQPVLTNQELAAVETASRELAAIGRNVNQIARALNEAHFQTERVRLDRLDALAQAIKRSRGAIGALVGASRKAWRGG